MSVGSGPQFFFVHICCMYFLRGNWCRTLKRTWNEVLEHKRPLISLPVISMRTLSPSTFSFLSKLSSHVLFTHLHHGLCLKWHMHDKLAASSLLCLSVYETQQRFFGPFLLKLSHNVDRWWGVLRTDLSYACFRLLTTLKFNRLIIIKVALLVVLYPAQLIMEGLQMH